MDAGCILEVVYSSLGAFMELGCSKIGGAVGHHPYFPSRTVGFRPIFSDRIGLGLRKMFVSFAKMSMFRRVSFVRWHKFFGVVTIDKTCNDPAVGQRISSEFSHIEIFYHN